MPRMAATEQSSEARRDYASPATWGDVESVRNEVIRVESRLERKIAEVWTEMVRMEMRLIRWMVATMLAGVAAIGVLYGILEAVR